MFGGFFSFWPALAWAMVLVLAVCSFVGLVGVMAFGSIHAYLRDAMARAALSAQAAAVARQIIEAQFLHKWRMCKNTALSLKLQFTSRQTERQTRGAFGIGSGSGDLVMKC